MYGSHHTRLVSCISSTWNDLLGRKTTRKLNLSPRPILRVVNSGEKFGLVASNDSTSFGGLIDIKKEEPREDLQGLVLHDSDGDHDFEHILGDLNIDPSLLHAPAITPVSHLQGTARRDLASKFISSTAPTHSSHAENSEAITSKSLETSLEVTVSCTSCTSVRACHAYMPEIQDLTNDSPHQSVLKRKGKCSGGGGDGDGDNDDDDDDDDSPIDPKRACLAADSEMQEITGSAPSAAAATSPPSGMPLPSNDLRLFFAKSREASQTSAQPRASTSASSSLQSDISLASLSQPLPLPVPTGTGIIRFTRSQLLFSVLTGINAHVLSIKTGDEFFLFIEMVRFGSVRFGQGFLRTENRTIGPVQRFSRTENRTVGSVRNGPVLVLKASEPEPDLFFFFLFSSSLILNPNL